MEGKVAIISFVLVSLLVLGQIQVEAQTRSCCPTTSARNIYNTCRFAGGSQSLCASTSGCRHLTGSCPPGLPHDMLENTGKAAYTMGDNVVTNSCCPNATARGRFDVCRATAPICARNAGCILVPTGLPCPPRWTHDMLKNTVNEYCKFGCSSSVCGAITTLRNSDASEVVNGAVEKCTDACSDFCTKGSVTAVETA